jgi:hypothetical protein
VFSLLAIFGVSVPIFWLGLLLMLLFALELGWLPATGMDGAAAFVLPALTLGLNAAALIARITFYPPFPLPVPLTASAAACRQAATRSVSPAMPGRGTHQRPSLEA